MLLHVIIGIVIGAVLMFIFKDKLTSKVAAVEADAKALIEKEKAELQDLETKVGDKTKSILSNLSAEEQAAVQRFVYLKNKLTSLV